MEDKLVRRGTQSDGDKGFDWDSALALAEVFVVFAREQVVDC